MVVRLKVVPSRNVDLDRMTNFTKYVINLEYRNDRRSEMTRQLDAIGWSAQFFAAVRPTEPEGFPSIGSRGCFLSHLSAMKRAPNGHLLLMEDDLDFMPDFSRMWSGAYGALTDLDWSIFYPGHILADRPKGLTLLEPNVPVQCTHFILINEKARSKIVGALETILARPAGHPLGGPMHVDGAYSTIRAQNPDLKTYVFSPSLGYQRSSRSDIASGRLLDGFAFLKPFMSGMRRVKQTMVSRRHRQKG
jgi:glycosyl transferase family 25